MSIRIPAAIATTLLLASPGLCAPGDVAPNQPTWQEWLKNRPQQYYPPTSNTAPKSTLTNIPTAPSGYEFVGEVQHPHRWVFIKSRERVVSQTVLNKDQFSLRFVLNLQPWGTNASTSAFKVAYPVITNEDYFAFCPSKMVQLFRRVEINTYNKIIKPNYQQRLSGNPYGSEGEPLEGAKPISSGSILEPALNYICRS